MTSTTRAPRKQIHLAAHFPGVNNTTVWSDPAAGSHIEFSSFVRLAQTAERAKFDFFFLAEGLRLIRAAGFADHLDATIQQHPPVPRGQVMPGDLAIVPTSPGERAALGIAQGEMVYVLPASRRGIGLVSIDRASSILGVR